MGNWILNMKFSDAKDFIRNAIESDSDLQGIPLSDAVTANYDDEVRSALRDTGLALVIVPVQGIRNTVERAVDIEHEIMVAVLENTLANSTGNSALDVSQSLIVAIDNAALSMNSRKLHLTSGTPAYELGTTEANPVTIFCNFKYRTLHT